MPNPNPNPNPNQARAPRKLDEYEAKGFQATVEKADHAEAQGYDPLQAEPWVSKTRANRMLKIWHQEKHRVGFFHSAQGSGKTWVQCLLPLLSGYSEYKKFCPPELRARDISLLSAPDNVLIEQMRVHGLGEANLASLKESKLHKFTGIPVEVLAAFNARVLFLKDEGAAKRVDWSRVREKYNVIVASVPLFTEFFKAQRETPPAKRFQPRDVRLCIGDEAHIGLHWPDSPWFKPKKDKSWQWVIAMCPYATIVKFSGSKPEQESDLPNIDRCTAGELMRKGRQARPKVFNWTYEGLAKMSGEPYRQGQLEKTDVEDLRLNPVQTRRALCQIGRKILANRAEKRKPSVAIVRTQASTSAFIQRPQDVANHLQHVFDGLPACALTGKKLRVVALYGKAADMNAEETVKFALKYDVIVVEEMLTVGYNTPSVDYCVNLRKVSLDCASQQSHQQFFGRGNRVWYAGDLELRDNLRVAALFHVGCETCQHYTGDFDWAEFRERAKTPFSRDARGHCVCSQTCWNAIEKRHEEYLDALDDYGGPDPEIEGQIKPQEYEIHELLINCEYESYASCEERCTESHLYLGSIQSWMEEEEAKEFMPTVTTERYSEHDARMNRRCADAQLAIDQSRAQALAARQNAVAQAANEAAEAARRGVLEAAAKRQADAEQAAAEEAEKARAAAARIEAGEEQEGEEMDEDADTDIEDMEVEEGEAGELPDAPELPDPDNDDLGDADFADAEVDGEAPAPGGARRSGRLARQASRSARDEERAAQLAERRAAAAEQQEALAAQQRQAAAAARAERAKQRA